ncbi:FmdB family zinc ribbon protein [Egicoccus halophilus]|uniref:Putative regulatory protein FmdB zinc ribbon domain-containing protein n=1 Tax=Egicoccus halophilus TaxID=1670830 RepID=A0A8J3A5Y3_9ACTN|nr:FmdB family zinc ribbon protein [Egicoccus halophilus]GGI03637.1 hypothetical protein GCM10011354_05030 [Egicoccus halophilus]
MPTYEYACRDCGEHLEVVQSFQDDALTECPTCSGSLRKVYSAAGLIFKGSGWHVKDYAASSKRGGGNRGESSSEGSSSEGSSSESSSDTGAAKDSGTKGGSSSEGSSSNTSSTSSEAKKSA